MNFERTFTVIMIMQEQKKKARRRLAIVELFARDFGV